MGAGKWSEGFKKHKLVAAGRRPKEAFVFSASRVSHGSQYLVIGGIVLGKVASNQKFCELPNTLFLK